MTIGIAWAEPAPAVTTATVVIPDRAYVAEGRRAQQDLQLPEGRPMGIVAQMDAAFGPHWAEGVRQVISHHGDADLLKRTQEAFSTGAWADRHVQFLQAEIQPVEFHYAGASLLDLVQCLGDALRVAVRSEPLGTPLNLDVRTSLRHLAALEVELLANGVIGAGRGGA